MAEPASPLARAPGSARASPLYSVGNVLGRFVLSWQKVFLEGDERYRQFLLQFPPSMATANSKTNVN